MFHVLKKEQSRRVALKVYNPMRRTSLKIGAITEKAISARSKHSMLISKIRLINRIFQELRRQVWLLL
jgi:hypothetical protein